MQCNYNSFIQIINFHGLFRNALRCRKTGACRILVPLGYTCFCHKVMLQTILRFVCGVMLCKAAHSACEYDKLSIKNLYFVVR